MMATHFICALKVPTHPPCYMASYSTFMVPSMHFSFPAWRSPFIHRIPLSLHIEWSALGISNWPYKSGGVPSTEDVWMVGPFMTSHTMDEAIGAHVKDIQ